MLYEAHRRNGIVLNESEFGESSKIIRVFTSKFPNRCLYFLFNIISMIIPIKLKIDKIIERKFLTVTKYTIHAA